MADEAKAWSDERRSGNSRLVYVKELRTIVTRRPCGACKGRGYFEYRGDMLRKIRQDSGLSLREVARRLKLTPAYICDIELNRRGATDKVSAFYKGLQDAK